MASLNEQDLRLQRFTASLVRGLEGLLGMLPADAGHLPDAETFTLALHLLDFALESEAVWPQAREVLLRLAPQMEQAGYRDNWQPYLERAIATAPSLQDSVAVGELAFYLGRLHELRGRFAEAQAALAQSATIFARLQSPQDEARSISRRAYVARLQQQYDEAQELVAQAQGLAPDDPLSQATCYLTLGTVAFDRRQWVEATAYLQKAVALWETNSDRRMVALSLRNLGPALHMQKRYGEAIDCYERALDIFQELPDPVNQAVTQMNLGIIHSLQGRDGDALALYNKAEVVLRRVEDTPRLANLLANQAISCRHLARWDEAESRAREAIALALFLGNLPSVINATDTLIYALRGQERLDEARATRSQALARLAEMEAGASRDALQKMLDEHLPFL